MGISTVPLGKVHNGPLDQILIKIDGFVYSEINAIWNVDLQSLVEIFVFEHNNNTVTGASHYLVYINGVLHDE